MRLAATVVLALSIVASFACSADEPMPTHAVAPSYILAALVRFEPPKGWTREESATGGGTDPAVAYVDGLDRITVRVYGAPGSVYRIPADFLSGPAASTLGRTPGAIGRVTVAGRELPLYEQGFPIHLGDPHEPSPPLTLGRAVFCVLPSAGDRFVVLSYARESPAPDVERRGERAWEAFLRSVQLVGEP